MERDMMLVETEYAEKQPGTIIARHKLLDMLKNRNIKGGESLKESVLAKQFDVSRTAVKEALASLDAWGLVEYVPYCSYKVRNITLDDYICCYEMREAVEPVAAQRFAERHTDKAIEYLEYLVYKIDQAERDNDMPSILKFDSRFHAFVVENCGNPFLINMFEISSLTLSIYVYDDILCNLPKYIKKTASLADVHRSMFERIKNGDADGAREEFRLHIIKVKQALKEYIKDKA